MMRLVCAALLLIAACAREEAARDAGALSGGGQTEALAFSCSGAEPFWALTIGAESATLQSPADDGVETRDFAGAWIDADMNDGEARWSSGTLDVIVRRETCSLPSGEEVAYATDLSSLFPQSAAAPGCCRRGGE